MVWKKRKRSFKGSRKLRSVAEEARPKLKSCLKKPQEVSSSDKDQSSQKESNRISGDGSSSNEGSHSVGSIIGNWSVESRGSAESSSLQRNAHSNDYVSSTDGSSTVHPLSQSQNSERSAQSGSQICVQKRVRFNAIHVRDYERIVGDNPSCTTGPPLS
jgi:hypothetical protein